MTDCSGCKSSTLVKACKGDHGLRPLKVPEGRKDMFSDVIVRWMPISTHCRGWQRGFQGIESSQQAIVELPVSCIDKNENSEKLRDASGQEESTAVSGDFPDGKGT